MRGALKFKWLVLIFWVFLFCGCLNSPVVPIAENGVMDLRHWDFQENGPISLSGQWVFFWNRMVPPEQFSDLGAQEIFNGVNRNMIRVPGTWNGAVINGETIVGTGFATYYLRVLFPPGDHRLSLKLLDMATAFRIFANGKELASSGEPGINSAQSVPEYLPQSIDFKSQGQPLELVVHVSNFHHWQGGIWEPVLLGLSGDIQAMEKERMALGFFLFGAIVIMGLYQLGLYGYRRKDRSSLYFGLFNFMIGLRLMVHGERYLVQAFDGIGFRTLISMIYLSLYLCVPLFVLYTRSLYPEEVSRRFSLFSILASLGFSVLVLVTPPLVFSRSMPVFQCLTVLLLIYGVWVITKAIRNRRQGSVMFAVGFLVLSATIVNDILYTRHIIVSVHMVSGGLFIFIVSQALLLSRRFSSAFLTIEKQAQELAAANIAYGNELGSKTRAQAELKASKEQYRQLIEDSPDGICIIRKDEIQYANAAFLEIAGIKNGGLQGIPFLEFIYPDDREKLLERYGLGEARANVEGHFTIRGQTRDGNILELELNSSLIQWQKKSAIMTFVRDVTEQVQTREFLLQSEKMLSIGGLAAGMAHEINNPLAGMVQNAQVVANRMAPGLTANDKAAREVGTDMDTIAAYVRKRSIPTMLDNILSAGEIAVEVVDNMLSFARKPILEKQPCDLASVVEKTLSIASNDFGLKDQYDFKHIRIRKQFEPGLKNALCEESKIQQVLLNLFKNAAQAMWENRSSGRAPEICIRLSDLGKMICIAVKDNGPGMEEEVRKRVFEPFFTTKDTNSGTGLGMSVSYFIITKDHGGKMEVRSVPGEGTEFVICLPGE